MSKDTQKIKVLMIGPDRSVQGGVSGVVNNLYDTGLDRKITLRYIGTMVDGSKFKKLLKAIQAYIKVSICIKDYDILHVNVAADASYYRKSLFMKLALKHNKKLVIHQHGGDINRFYGNDLKGSKRDEMVRLFNACDKFIVLTKAQYDFFRHIVDKEKLCMLPNTIKIPDYDISTKDYSNRNILFLGRICKDKGINELLEAVNNLKDKYPDLHLTLAGRFEEPEFREKIAADSKHISAPGWITGSDKEELLKSHSIFILPSYFEGMPLSPIESMAYGCATIVTKVGGMQYMLEDQKEGLMIQSKSATAIENALDQVLSNENYRKQLGHAGRILSEKKYNINKTVDDLVSIYSSVI
ncbi:Glycosyltransferase involved in cell wall bisynthesis [Butyrivibrio fibrisolvens DSM 3071]|uniref:Glycosyltransferase involved in cell wall bisynthesis n=1 Tax=Butyrivibrio fibrisolvens DSM 3071 TaxID=1121131 RepID=A0A1M6A5M9_BUTFI|nr:glycosyltransferase family 4 protein [Butyrivibrio fibrisolvens]SHI31719.1 Glycosyltransferase involved in cell wall bisynthesis [Butyrivibrio fibrisolvens DSM 3071]